MAGATSDRKLTNILLTLAARLEVFDARLANTEVVLDYLVVDIARILDESTAGRKASEELSKRWELAQQEFQQLLERAQSGDQEAGDRAAELEATVPDEIERRRDDLRRQLIELVKPIIAAIAQNKGSALVLRADQTLAYNPQAEITDQVLKELERS